MATFYADSAVGGSGVTYDEADWDDYGYTDAETGLFAAFNDVLAISQDAADSATSAAASALTAVNAPGTSATSSTSNSVGTGSKTWTIQTGKAFAIGQYVVIADDAAPATNYMLGRITAHNSGTGSLTVSVATSAGSGTKTAWTISLASDPAGAVSTSRQVLAGGIATGGGALTGDVTITVTKAAGTDLLAGSDDAKAVTSKAVKDSVAFGTITDGATVTLDLAVNVNYTWTIGGNRTLANPSNMVVGMRGTIRITQDGTGNRTLSFGSKWKKPGGSIALSTAAGAIDRLDFQVIDANTIDVTISKAMS